MEGDYKSRLLICSVQEKLRTKLLGTSQSFVSSLSPYCKVWSSGCNWGFLSLFQDICICFIHAKMEVTCPLEIWNKHKLELGRFKCSLLSSWCSPGESMGLQNSLKKVSLREQVLSQRLRVNGTVKGFLVLAHIQPSAVSWVIKSSLSSEPYLWGKPACVVFIISFKALTSMKSLYCQCGIWTCWMRVSHLHQSDS